MVDRLQQNIIYFSIQPFILKVTQRNCINSILDAISAAAKQAGKNKEEYVQTLHLDNSN